MRRLALALALALAVALALVAATADAQEPVAQALDDPSGHALDGLHAALARDRALVSVWGASHVASDQFTSVFRDVLARRHGDGGPGQFFPTRPLTLYDRRDVALGDGHAFQGVSTRGHLREDDYGRAGIALDTREAARACARPIHGASLQHVEAWALGQAGGGTLTLEVDGATRSVSTGGRAPLVRVALDVAGAREICIATPGDGPVRSFGVIAESGAGVVVESFGVPGARAEDALLWRESSFAAQLSARPPDAFVLAYGTNESARARSAADLRADMTRLVARFRAAAPAASCVIVGPSDRPRFVGGAWRPRAQSTRVRDAYRDAARASGCAFFDLLAWTGGPGSLADWSLRGWALPDRVHFTDESYARLGRDLAAAIDPL